MSLGILFILGLMAAIPAYFAFKCLRVTPWFSGWLRGTIGLSLLAISAFCVVIAVDVMSYKPLLNDKSIGTLEIKQLKNQHFSVEFSQVGADKKQVYSIVGDMWQLDARVFTWSDSLAIVGVKPTYRLDRLSGRYFSVEQEQDSRRSIFEIPSEHSYFDTWTWLNDNKGVVPGVDTAYGTAVYLPLADGALYEVLLSNKGLVAKPLNKLAEAAVNEWQ